MCMEILPNGLIQLNLKENSNFNSTIFLLELVECLDEEPPYFETLVAQVGDEFVLNGSSPIIELVDLVKLPALRPAVVPV